eukprot:3701472-Rhodomonas_salina.1
MCIRDRRATVPGAAAAAGPGQVAAARGPGEKTRHRKRRRKTRHRKRSQRAQRPAGDRHGPRVALARRPAEQVQVGRYAAVRARNRRQRDRLGPCQGPLRCVLGRANVRARARRTAALSACRGHAALSAGSRGGAETVVGWRPASELSDLLFYHELGSTDIAYAATRRWGGGEEMHVDVTTA